MTLARVILDSNIMVAALRSRRGASYQLVSEIGLNRFTICISNALILEYEEVMRRTAEQTGFPQNDVDTVLAYIYSHAEKTIVRFRTRPFLVDADDDMVMEAAIAG